MFKKNLIKKIIKNLKIWKVNNKDNKIDNKYKTNFLKRFHFIKINSSRQIKKSKQKVLVLLKNIIKIK